MSNWQREKTEKETPTIVEIVRGALEPGQDPPKPTFVSVYKDTESGRTVTGRGDTIEEAQINAQEKI